MKLDEYVKQTLLDITESGSAAQAVSKHWIAPGYVDGEKVFQAQLVSFDIGVTVSKEAGGGIQVWSFGDLKAKGTAEHTNRISFSVPIYFQAPANRQEDGAK